MLKQHYIENGQKLNSIIQDTVTNIANNAPGMVVGALTGIPALGQVTFGVSVFGNAYKEAAKLGITDSSRLLVYSLATTASEVGLSSLISGLPGMGGMLSGKAIEGLSKNVSNAIGKAAIKITGNAFGEFIEEGTQSLLSPILQKYILGADVETVADDPLGSLSDAAYEGFIGALTSVLTGGISSYAEAVNEANIQASGKYYKAVFAQNKADVKNIAKFFDETSDEKSNVKKLAQIVARGDTSDLAFGNMMIAVAKETQESNRALFTKIGENVRNSDGGVEAVISVYEEAIEENKNIFPDKVSELYSKIAENENAGDELVGEFALAVETYAPRAAIMGDIIGKTFGAETEAELASADINNADTEAVTADAEGAGEVNDGESVFTERSAQKPEYDMLADGLNYGTDRVRLSEDQLTVASTGRALGHKVVFEDTKKTQGFESNGYIEADGTIHIDYNCKNPVEFVLKHELTHFGEGTEKYKSFAKEVKDSQAYEQWINKKVGGVETAAVKSAIYRKRIMDNYAANGVELTPTQAEAELIADFTGEVLFRADGSGLKSIMSDMSNSRRSKFVNFFKDFITYLKAKLTRNKAITAEVLKLERLFNEALSAAEQKNIAAESDVKHSFAGEKAKTADKTLLESAKERIENGEDSETVRQETGWFKGYDGKWRFEINDSAAELNDKPDFEVKGDNSSGFYRVAPLEEVLKHDDLFKAYPELKDYTIIVQETNPGTQGSFFKDDNQIVLSNTLFRKESEKYKNSVNEKYEEIRKIEQSPEFKEYNKFYDDPELAKIDAEQWLVLEKEAEKKFYSSEIGKRYYKLKWGKSEVPRYELGWSDAAKSVLMHEIQHAVQDIEGFGSGANPQYWANKTSESEKNYISAKQAFEKKAEGLVDVLYRYGFYDKYGEDFDILSGNGIDTAKSYLEEIEAPRGAIDMVEDLKELETERDNAFELWRELKKRSSGELYKSTAGEVESRDVSSRLDMTAEERKNTRPDIDRTDVVFADGGVSYSLRPGAESDVGKALRDKNYTEDVYLTESSPSIIVSQKGTHNLPMLMKASHIRENVFTEQEAKGLGLKVDEHTHYHGLGKTLFLKIIDGLNDVKLAYRGTKNASDPSRRENYFLLISQYKDANGNTVNIPVYINEKGQYNRVFIDTNKIATVFGRDNFSSYIQKEIEKGNLVRIKNKSTQASELTALIADSYSKNAFTDNRISQSDTVVKNNISENAEKYSEQDTLGNTLTKAQQSYFANSKVRDDNGSLKVMYHGTPNADFTVFKSGSYFTENKQYADVYQNQGASSFRYKKDANNPDTYAVYLDIEKPFDTRNKTERDIFYNEYYQQWGTGTDLMESGLPDWMDGQDLQEFLEENGYDYDGLILDEGGTGGYGDEVQSRGLSYVVFSPEQVKSIDNKTPTENTDIRYSIPDRQAEHLNVGGVLFDTELLEKVYKAQRKVEKAEKSKEQKGLKAAKRFRYNRFG